MTIPVKKSDAFLIQQAKPIVKGLFERKPAIYWADFLISTIVGYGFAAFYILNESVPLLSVGAFLIAGAALFRAGTFIHEIVHMPKGCMVGFRVTWNLVCGIPLLMPSFLYGNHVDHHSRRHYGTPADGEYLPLAAGPVREIFVYLVQVPVLPLLAVLRFLILTPLSLLHPRLRGWVWERASSYVCNPYYRRSRPGQQHSWWLAAELSCCAGLAVIAGLVAAGAITWITLLQVYLLGAYAVGLNWVRNLAAHRYRNTGESMNHVKQFLDSVTIEGRSWLTLLLFPVGLRYHALHHLFPSLHLSFLGRSAPPSVG